MLSTASRVFLLGGVLFAMGVVLIFLALDRGRGALLWMGLAALMLSVASLAAGSWLTRKKTSLVDRRREQQLWRSGPLGRRWLESRNRMR
jgi:hypothetical protein